ncbi:TetR/AcrR family transcriptional regulator [Mycolicibacterium smegmatis]|uniref:TetR/AcrR family transcriptional regulator n=1 Tax=Mycolicibacterium smegmatis TaxID=1772 RepID=UPI0020A42358|nr:TetR/AcrR family transcriptional regulator [Mycolicibacterium smegmatis]MCP2625707.1 TetR/AcrR family transcriptional regulator [Mycolicibacterium smegmatis]
MSIEERRERERAARRELIISTARRLAEAEGWQAVTTRRLSAEIEYSQPVLYKHFAGMEELADAVALDGFGELAEAMRQARRGDDHPDHAVTRIAQAYLDFARANPAVYDAMFARTTNLRFAADDTPSPLAEAFAELRDAVGRNEDADTLTEVLWAALHGLVTLSRTGRLRPDHDTERLELLVRQFTNRCV